MKTTQTSETFSESAKMAEKWFKNANETLAGVYNKQLNLALGAFNNWYNVMLRAGSPAQSFNFTPLLGGQDLSRLNFLAGSSPVYWGWFDKAWQQMLSSNQEMVSFLNNTTRFNTDSWEEFNTQYSAFLEKRFEILSSAISTMADAYRKNLDTSLGEYRKITEQLNEQTLKIIRQNEELWNQTLKAFGNYSKQNPGKDLLPVETRKKTNGVAA